METILNSFLLVAATEMGDKTQLLALMLATRYRKPWTIMAAILTATILNHFLAAVLGSWISTLISPEVMKWGLAIIFFAFAAWVLVPDKDETLSPQAKYGAFLTTLVLFFLAEMGDKTQLSTVALALKYDSILLVTIGTTLGMLFADGLAVFLGERLTKWISLRLMRFVTALLFVASGIAVLIGF
jgi:putative Ca2+/H+ antiporter (TMEM165/GDT1 family)